MLELRQELDAFNAEKQQKKLMQSVSNKKGYRKENMTNVGFVNSRSFYIVLRMQRI